MKKWLYGSYYRISVDNRDLIYNEYLNNGRSEVKILKHNTDKSLNYLENYISQSDFKFHLIGVNRHNSYYELKSGNENITSMIIDTIKKTGSFDVFVLILY